jgi:hypothetical protein
MVRNIFLSLQTIKKGSLLLFLSAVILGHFIAYKIVHVPAQLEMVVLFVLLIFYPVLRFPHLGVLLLFTIMPFIPYIRRLYYLQYTRPSADPLIIIGDLLVFLMMTGLFFEIKERISEPRSRITYLLVIYLLYVILRTFVFNISPGSDAILKFRMYGPAVLLFFIGSAFAFNHAIVSHVIKLTIIIGIFAAVYGFQQLFFGYSQAEQIWFSSISFTTLFIEGLARPFSIFQSPASFADYMQLSIISLIILFGNVKNTIFKGFFLPLIPIYFYATLITSVRSNWVGIIVSLFLWLFFVFLKNKYFKVLLLIITVVGFSISQFIDFDSNPLSPMKSLLKNPQNERHIELLITDRADAITNPFEEHSLLSRLNLWKFIFDLSLEPFMGLLGRGIGTLNADSIYFTYLAELGYPGFFFIIFLTITFIVRGLSLAERSTGYIRSLAQGVTIMNITFAIINITGTHIHSFPGDAFFWFFNGIIIKHEFLIRKSISHQISNEITPNN